MADQTTDEIVTRLEEHQAWVEKHDATASGRAKAYSRGVVQGLKIALEALTAVESLPFPEPASEAIGRPAFLPPHTKVDWIEDASLENGSYYCECVNCKQIFAGHKRRVVCRICAGLPEPAAAPPTAAAETAEGVLPAPGKYVEYLQAELKTLRARVAELEKGQL
jgi:hypothetical protein